MKAENTPSHEGAALPPGWELASIEEFCDPRVDQSPPSKSVPYIDIGSIDRATKAIGELVKVDARTAPTRARQWVQRGDVLVSMTRPNLNAVAFVPPDLEGAVASTGFDILRAKHVLPELLFYRVRSQEFISDICRGLQGVVYPAVRPRDIRRHRMPIPPFAEQKRILKAIGTIFARLELAESALQRVQKNLGRYRASVLKTAVEGRLVATEADLACREGRTYEPASELLKRILVERRRRWGASGRRGRYEEPAALDTSNFPKLPEAWCWTTIDHVADVGTGATPKRGSAQYWERGTIPWVTSAVVNSPAVRVASEMVTQEALDQTNLTLYPSGTLLVAMYGEGKTRGKVTELFIPATTNQALAALVLSDSASFLKEWVLLALEHNYENLRAYASGGVQPNLNLTLIRNVPLPLPPLLEQHQIIAEVKRCLQYSSRMLETVAVCSRRCERLRQSILKSAFEGRLVDQDPNDEPASVLLERIHASRAADSRALLRAAKSSNRKKEPV